MTAMANPPDLTGFDWRSRITGPLQTNVMYKVRLPASVVGKLKSFPLDIRVVDEAGLTWPCMIWVGPVNDAQEVIKPPVVILAEVDEPAQENNSQHYLMFMPRSARKAYLYFGSTRYQLPAASFVRGIDGASVDRAPEASLARRLPNPARMVESLDAYWHGILYLLGVIVASTIIIMGVRLARMRYFS